MPEYIYDIDWEASDDGVFLRGVCHNLTELVRCRDCIYYESNSFFGRDWHACAMFAADRDGSEYWPDPDDYCSKAERKKRR